MICFMIDELTPCLKDTETGDIVETEVIQIKRKSFLSKYNKRTGWIVNWSELLKNNEVYALVIKGTVDIQGLVALRNDISSNAVYIQWAVAAPQNNKWDFNHQKYSGVGGHLFAIAIAKSFEFGYDGTIYGDAVNENVLKHYINAFSAIHIPTRSFPYRIIIAGEDAKNIWEVYQFDWNNFNM